MRALSLRSMQLAANRRLPYNTHAVARKKVQKVESITHDQEKRPNIPSAEMEGLLKNAQAQPVKVSFPRKNNPDLSPELYTRNPDIDPQLVWKGKEDEDSSPLTVDAVPIYVQEKILPKAIIESLLRRGREQQVAVGEKAPDLFEDWSQELSPEHLVEFYAHTQKWANRMILGDSLLVMTSLAEKEGLKGQVQCVYCDPPYGINFRSNWQPSTRSRTVSDSKAFEAREPEVVRAFRDTWNDGLHSFLRYMRDRIVVARELISDSGSFFLQIGEQNVHLLRSLLDEVFGAENFVSQITIKTNPGLGTVGLPSVSDYIVWYAKNRKAMKLYKLYDPVSFGGGSSFTSVRTARLADRKMTREEIAEPQLLNSTDRPYTKMKLMSSGYTDSCFYDVAFQGRVIKSGTTSWRTNQVGMQRLIKADRIIPSKTSLYYRQYYDDFPVKNLNNIWADTAARNDPIYVVQTNNKIIQRCILMTTDPGDLVVDPTCGSGTTAFIAEQWGRRWITTDTSRVAITLARARMTCASYDYYLLSDSPEGKDMEKQISGKATRIQHFSRDVKHGFVYKGIPHIMLSSISRSSDVDAIWERWKQKLEPLRDALNAATGQKFEEWEVPADPDNSWKMAARNIHEEWWQARIARQSEIDSSILRNADTEYLRDRPVCNENILRVAGPFTVESLSPHRVLPTDAEDGSFETYPVNAAGDSARGNNVPLPDSQQSVRPKSIDVSETSFLDIVFENLRKAGVQNTKKGERLEFDSLEIWPRGRCIQYLGRYSKNGADQKVAICVGPEYGTVTRSLMVQAAREASDYFNLLVVLGFAFESHADEERINIGSMPVLRARMNNDLHMADRLKTGKSGNLFVVFGEPDIQLRKLDDGKCEVEILGVDIFDPTTGEVKASGPEEIACWFIDTDYNDEAFFVRHAYFSGGGPDPFKQLKRTLNAEVNEEAWATMYSTVSRPFPPPHAEELRSRLSTTTAMKCSRSLQ